MINIEQRLEHLENALISTNINTKEVLTFDETANYTGLSKSYLYKLTSRKEIPHFKPTGKLVYFNRKEVETWLQDNRVSTTDEIQAQAQAYCLQKGGKK
ncbi:MAG: helix-turn-helix domain-containing protein [Rikenellaceae bacterium]